MAFNKIKYDNEYIKNNYDRLNIQVPKGQKQVIKEHYIKLGYNSLNEYVNSLIHADIEKHQQSHN